MRRALGRVPIVVVLLARAASACPAPGVEICDGIDNDGDTFVDEDENPDAGEPPLCSGFGQLCLVADGAKAQCASPSKYGGTFECPGGQTRIDDAVRSGTGEPIQGGFCFSFDACGGCFGERCDDQGNPVCGADPLPRCVCRPDGRCLDPCSGVSCPAGYACRQTEPKISTCQPNGDCRIAGGCAPGELCFQGACFPDPCSPNPCAPNQVCRGTAYGPSCESSCADVDCDPGTFCFHGACYLPPTGCTLVADANFCPPLTVCRPDGTCGEPPCLGVRCPEGQSCVDDDCQRTTGAGDASAPPGALDASVLSPDAGTAVKLKGVASGEVAGCGCSVPSRERDFGGAPFAAIVLALARRHRGRRFQAAGRCLPRY